MKPDKVASQQQRVQQRDNRHAERRPGRVGDLLAGALRRPLAENGVADAALARKKQLHPTLVEDLDVVSDRVSEPTLVPGHHSFSCLPSRVLYFSVSGDPPRTGGGRSVPGGGREVRVDAAIGAVDGVDTGDLLGSEIDGETRPVVADVGRAGGFRDRRDTEAAKPGERDLGRAGVVIGGNRGQRRVIKHGTPGERRVRHQFNRGPVRVGPQRLLGQVRVDLDLVCEHGHVTELAGAVEVVGLEVRHANPAGEAGLEQGFERPQRGGGLVLPGRPVDVQQIDGLDTESVETRTR